MANAKMEEMEPIMVLQRRHLYKQPLEYLVKHRGNSGKFKETWISQAALVAMDKGSLLIRQFKKTKVGQMGVDAYLGKRRSTMRKSISTGQIDATGNPDSKSLPNHIPVSVSDSAESDTGKTKGSLKPGTSALENSFIHHASASDTKSELVGAKTKLSPKFAAQHKKNASAFSRHSFGNHKTKSSKRNSSLRHSAPILPLSHIQHRPLSRPKHPKRHKEVGRDDTESGQSEISRTVIRNSNGRFSKTPSSVNDDVVSVSSESSGDEVLYSLSQERNKKSGNGEIRLAGCSDLKRKSKDTGNSSKKLRVSETDTDSIKSDSEINFKQSSDSQNIPQKSLSEQGSMSQFLSRCSWGGYSPQCLVDGLNFSDSKNRNSTPAAFDPPARPRKKKNHADNVVDDNIQIERRISVRQTESAFRFKEIVVRKCSKYMHLVTLSQTPAKNAFNPKVFHELTVALRNAINDDCHVVLLTASGNMFSSGIDVDYLLNFEEDRKLAAKNMATSLRDFINCLIAFPKPIVVAVNGPAIGLGMAILPLCDIVYASDKACFSCPYTTLCQTPEGCASYTFPKMMGMAMANELLFRGRKITALEANQIGLITQVFWPDNLMSEVTPRVQHLASQSLKVMESTKALIRSNRRSKLEYVNAAECQMLMERWTSAECQRAMKLYLEKANDLA